MTLRMSQGHEHSNIHKKSYKNNNWVSPQDKAIELLAEELRQMRSQLQHARYEVLQHKQRIEQYENEREQYESARADLAKLANRAKNMKDQIKEYGAALGEKDAEIEQLQCELRRLQCEVNYQQIVRGNSHDALVRENKELHEELRRCRLSHTANEMSALSKLQLRDDMGGLEKRIQQQTMHMPVSSNNANSRLREQHARVSIPRSLLQPALSTTPSLVEPRTSLTVPQCSKIDVHMPAIPSNIGIVTHSTPKKSKTNAGHVMASRKKQLGHGPRTAGPHLRFKRKNPALQVVQSFDDDHVIIYDIHTAAEHSQQYRASRNNSLGRVYVSPRTRSPASALPN
mmetsp:Transcript_57142/g.94939  ORF Transcript_57142/g.94939 Transcript_57142/m.94939 type:complete len:342 (-) Transcript_57142:232-1257(-)